MSDRWIRERFNGKNPWKPHEWDTIWEALLVCFIVGCLATIVVLFGFAMLLTALRLR